MKLLSTKSHIFKCVWNLVVPNWNANIFVKEPAGAASMVASIAVVMKIAAGLLSVGIGNLNLTEDWNWKFSYSHLF